MNRLRAEAPWNIPLAVSRPLFTIVTPSFNCGRYLRRNLASIRSQNMPEGQIEHWVIDGGSSDETLEILQAEPGVRFISEKDAGLTEAVNKGLRLAQGEWILWINADDELAPGALEAFLRAAREFPEARMFCGAQRVYDYEGNFKFLNAGWAYTFERLAGPHPWIVQASTFVHRRVYEKVGLLDPSFRYAMDYEWLVRASREFPTTPLPDVLTHYHCRVGSIMDANLARFHQDFLRIRRRYGLPAWSLDEFRFRFYIWTESLRRIGWLRRAVRRVKTAFGVPVP